jgi:hypothetical protein
MLSFRNPSLTLRNLVFWCAVCFATHSLTHAAEEKQSSASSSGNTPSDRIFRIEGSYGLMSGVTGNSFSGATTYSVVTGLEEASHLLRFFGNFQLDYVPTSSLDLAGTTTSISYSAFKIALGVACFPMTGSGMQPFLSVAGTYARGGVNVSPETTELSNFFRTNHYGYEASVGVDFKRNRNAQARLRLRASYSFEQGKLDSISAFKSNGLKLSTGFGF